MILGLFQFMADMLKNWIVLSILIWIPVAGIWFVIYYTFKVLTPNFQ